MRVYRSRNKSKKIAIATAVVASFALMMPTAAVPAVAAQPISVPEQLTAKVTTDGVYRHLRAFQRIADTNGGNRAAGTPGYQKSVEYVVNALTRAGFAVSTPEFSYSAPEVIAAKLAVDGVSYKIKVLDGSANSPQGGRTAKISGARGFGCAAADYPASTKGAIALIQRGSCTFSQKRDFAAGAGAVAAIVYNNEASGVFEGDLGGPSTGIPVVALSQQDGKALLGKQGRNASLEARVEQKQFTAQNVIAETKTGRTDNVVMAGSHLDGVPAGPGMNDNGSGSAALLETALQLGGSPKTENAVRFAWWGAEELGLLGSEAYVKNLTFNQQLDIAMYMNFDMIGSPNAGYFVNGDDPNPAAQEPLGSKSIAKVFADYLQTAKGIVPEKGPLGGGTDHVPFARAGIASAGLFTGVNDLMSAEQAKKWGGQANQPYDPNYHRVGDNLNNINRTAIGANSSAMAWAIGTFAQSSSLVNGIPPREQRADLQRKVLRSPASVDAADEAFPVNDPKRGGIATF